VTLGPGDRLPDLGLATLDGGTWTPAALSGRRAVLFCFASW
jgi:peroxiredoxin